MNVRRLDEVDLFETLALIESADEARNFMVDLCTPSELKAFVERWKVCQLLNKNFPYREIKEITGASLTTIGRVARFLNNESYGGYEEMLKKTEQKKGKK